MLFAGGRKSKLSDKDLTILQGGGEHLCKSDRLYRRILFVIRHSKFDSYWEVIDVLEKLLSEYKQMVSDMAGITESLKDLVNSLELPK